MKSKMRFYREFEFSIPLRIHKPFLSIFYSHIKCNLILLKIETHFTHEPVLYDFECTEAHIILNLDVVNIQLFLRQLEPGWGERPRLFTSGGLSSCSGDWRGAGVSPEGPGPPPALPVLPPGALSGA